MSEEMERAWSNSLSIDELRSNYVASPLASLCPTYVERGEGAVIVDVDGREIIDLSGGWGCLAVGYSHPRVIEAVKDQAERFLHTDFTSIPYSPLILLAKKLSELAPGEGNWKSAFFNSGAEAVENAVKIARAHTGRDGVVVFENAFHGRTLLTMTMTHKADPYKNGFGPFAPEVYRLPYPNLYRSSFDYRELEKELTRMVDPEAVAALVVEPVIGEGGFLVPPEGFLPYLRKLTKKYDIDLVFDEIQSGIGRTGRFFAAENFDVQADLITVAKSLASGLPLSGVIGRPEIMDSPNPSGIGGTYCGNPVACRAALAVIETIEEEDLLDRAKRLGRIIRSRFREMKERFPFVGDVRGLGAMNAMELVQAGEGREPASELTKRVVREGLERRVILPTAGLGGNVIRLLPPLVIEIDVLHRSLDALEESLEAAVEATSAVR